MKCVEERTGIAKNLVSQIRKELVDHGLIAYDQERITIDWDRMQIFAALEKPLPKHGKHTYAPVDVAAKDWSRIPLNKTQEAKRLKYRNPMRQLETWEEDFFHFMESLTAEEYCEIVCGMGADRTPPKQRYITITQPCFDEWGEPGRNPAMEYEQTSNEENCLRCTPAFETVEAF